MKKAHEAVAAEILLPVESQENARPPAAVPCRGQINVQTPPDDLALGPDRFHVFQKYMVMLCQKGQCQLTLSLPKLMRSWSNV